MAKYEIIPDCGPDGDDAWVTIWLPRRRWRSSVANLRTVAELYALAVTMNARSQLRFGLDVVTATIESDDGDVYLMFVLDTDFSEVYEWRDELEASATRIIARHGGIVRA